MKYFLTALFLGAITLLLVNFSLSPPIEEKMYTQKEVNSLLAKENQSILLLINTHSSNERAAMVLRDRIKGLNKM